ncbi:hypothetical protein ACFWIV_29080 [Streptomyces virginiae]|uniref:hypothetical protein n=1 Tax=Streptomyces virginiae TaxID=1961 RepID=UPI003650A123
MAREAIITIRSADRETAETLEKMLLTWAKKENAFRMDPAPEDGPDAKHVIVLAVMFHD